MPQAPLLNRVRRLRHWPKRYGQSSSARHLRHPLTPRCALLRGMTNPQPTDSQNPEPPTFRLTSAGIEATAQIRDGKFWVQAGSGARVETVASFEGHSYAPQRAKLIESGHLIAAGPGLLRYAIDVPFSKPSAAAAVTLGRSANGKNEWKRITDDGQKQTYGEWLETTSMALPPELTATDAADFVTPWKAFFRELAERLLDFEDRQPELTDILREAGIHLQHDEGKPLIRHGPILVLLSDPQVSKRVASGGHSDSYQDPPEPN